MSDPRKLSKDGFESEKQACERFDLLVQEIGDLRIYKEVRGRMIFNYPGKDMQDVRIDRVIIPSQKAVERGWTWGACGVEIKKNEKGAGRGASQCFDYMLSSFSIMSSVEVRLNWCFVFPMTPRAYMEASLMNTLRVGSIHDAGKWGLKWYVGSKNIVDRHGENGAYRFRAPDCGRRVGSR